MRFAVRLGILGALVGALGIAVVIIVPPLFPLELPNLDEPSLIYARPHRIAVGQNVYSSDLLERLTRLGYREVDSQKPREGEFQRSAGQLLIHRRAFRTPAASGEERAVALTLNRKGRIESMRASDGARLPSLVLEPDIIGELYTSLREYRDSVRLDEIPDSLVQAVITMEDRRFFEHGGLDLRRLAGAMWANLLSGGVVQGGSTLTQQLVKNVFLDARRTLGRKLVEAWLSLRLEAAESKDRILATYLNTIYLGQRGSVSIRGVEAAARHYFGKSVRELSVGESAMIAGLIPAPGTYSPYRDPATALIRRDRVLRVMRNEEVISEEQFQAAISEPLRVLPEPPRPASAPYFAAFVERELNAALPDADLRRSGLAVVTGLDASLQVIADDAVQNGLQKLEGSYEKLRRTDSPLQAALIALDPVNGDILAMVGGRNYNESQFDRATQAARQPGSVFKPIVALTALAQSAEGRPRYTLASQIEDTEFSVETRTGVWKPTNYNGKFSGVVSLRRALERSLNVPFARLAVDLGPEKIVSTARALGIESPLQPVPSIALGSFELTLLEVARAYAVFASGGSRVTPRPYTRVLDSQGNVLDTRSVESQQVFTPAEVAVVTSALQGAVERGTVRGLRAMGFSGPLAAKTGTTNDYRDAWLVGFTPDLVVVVWVGFDDGTNLGLTGSQAALPIFGEFIMSALGPAGGRGFPKPAGVEYVDIQEETGLRAGFACNGDPELFIVGTAPTEACRPSFVDRPPSRDSGRNPRSQVASGRRREDGERKEPRRSPVSRIMREVRDIFGGIFGGG